MHELTGLLDLFDTPHMGSRVFHALVMARIATMSQLIAMTRAELMCVPGLGRRGLDVLEQALAERGLYLADVSPPSLREPDWWRATLNELT